MRIIVVLPAPFGPDEPEEAGAGNVEVDARDRDLVVVALPQPAHHDRGPSGRPEVGGGLDRRHDAR